MILDRRGKICMQICCLLASLLATTYSSGSTSPVRIANLNWHSADVVGSAVDQLLVSRGISAQISPIEYTSSAKAMDALRGGHVDLVPECWYSCTTGSVVAFPLGIQGLEGFYLPRYLAKMQPALMDWNAAGITRVLQGFGLQIIGPPKSWGESYIAASMLCKTLGLELVTPANEQELLSSILSGLKFRRRFAFYLWKPHLIVSAYEVDAITLPNMPGGTSRNYFNSTVLYLAYSRPVRDRRPGAVIESGVFNTTMKKNDEMLRGLTRFVSLRTPADSMPYAKAVRSSARVFLCSTVSPRDNFWCSPEERWLKKKGPSYPSHLKIITQQCAGFSNCPKDSIEPKDGYSMDHLRKVLDLLGYGVNEYSIECQDYSATNELIRKTNLELADLTHSCITISSTRQALVDFSTPFYTTGLRVMIRRPSPNIFDMLLMPFSPFAPETWLGFFIFIIVMGLCFGFWEGKNNFVGRSRTEDLEEAAYQSEESDDCSISRSVRTSISRASPKVKVFRRSGSGVIQRRSLVNGVKMVGSVVLKKDTSGARTFNGQVTIMVVYLVSVLLATFYTAALSASLTVQRLSSSVQGVDDLRHKTVSTVSGTTIEEWLMENKPDIILKRFKSQAECVEALRDKVVDAYIYDEPVLEKFAADDKNCDFAIVGDVFYVQEYGIAFPKGHELLEVFSEAVTYLREDESVHTNLHKKYFTGKCEYKKVKISDTTVTPTHLSTLAIFLVLAVLLCLLHSVSSMCCPSYLKDGASKNDDDIKSGTSPGNFSFDSTRTSEPGISPAPAMTTGGEQMECSAESCEFDELRDGGEDGHPRCRETVNSKVFPNQTSSSIHL